MIPNAFIIATETSIAGSPIVNPEYMIEAPEIGKVIPCYPLVPQLYSVGVQANTGRLYIQGHHALMAPAQDGVPSGYRLITTHFWTDTLSNFNRLPEKDPFKQIWMSLVDSAASMHAKLARLISRPVIST